MMTIKMHSIPEDRSNIIPAIALACAVLVPLGGAYAFQPVTHSIEHSATVIFAGIVTFFCLSTVRVLSCRVVAVCSYCALFMLCLPILHLATVLSHQTRVVVGLVVVACYTYLLKRAY